MSPRAPAPATPFFSRRRFRTVGTMQVAPQRIRAANFLKMDTREPPLLGGDLRANAPLNKKRPWGPWGRSTVASSGPPRDPMAPGDPVLLVWGRCCPSGPCGVRGPGWLGPSTAGARGVEEAGRPGGGCGSASSVAWPGAAAGGRDRPAGSACRLALRERGARWPRSWGFLSSLSVFGEEKRSRVSRKLPGIS